MGDIYREFPYYCNRKLVGHYGNIDMWISDNNCLYIIINGFYENMVQITMSVKYPEGHNLYEIIMKVLDKLSKTLYYDYFGILMPRICRSLNEKPLDWENNSPTAPTDIIVYYQEDDPTEKEWNKPDDTHNCSGLFWMPLTEENIKYLSVEECEDGYYDSFCKIQCYITEDGEFDDTNFQEHILEKYL